MNSNNSKRFAPWALRLTILTLLALPLAWTARAQEATRELEQRLEDVRTPMDVAVIGCIVNGPGEAREADVGLTGASPNNLIYISGEPDHKIGNEDFVDHLEKVIRQRAAELEQARAEQDAEIISRS